MTSLSFLQYSKGTKLFRVFDRALLITYPVFFVICLYLFDRFIAKLHITAEKSMFFSLGLIFTLLIVSARALKRDFIDIEKLIIQELKDSKCEANLVAWKSHRLKKGFVDVVITLLLIMIPIAAILLPYENVLHKYFREIFVVALLLYIFVFGLRRLILFNDYLAKITRLYESLFKVAPTALYRPTASLHNLVISFVIALFCVLSANFIVPTIPLRFLILFAFAMWVLLFFAKALFDSRKMFYGFLEQLDILRGIKTSAKGE